MSQTLAVKYRPSTWDDVSEQETIKIILQQQMSTNTIKSAYLFCGGAGTGKTTCARIFANEINKGKGNPIEIDAASNNGVDNVREVIKQAQTKSLDSEYKIFIVDECHSISNTGWQAFLKLLEEPPMKSIFIFCTTDPQKIPKTILSRVQRYDFQRISQRGIVNRLLYILTEENEADDGERGVSAEAVEYIAKLADGHMRDAITMLDKCLAYSENLIVENITKALGVADYSEMLTLLQQIIERNSNKLLRQLSDIYYSGTDLKQFIKDLLNLVIDICTYNITKDLQFTYIPESYISDLDSMLNTGFDFTALLGTLIKLNSDIKWEINPKAMIQAALLLEVLN